MEIRDEMLRFKAEYPGMSGCAIWQMADIKGFIRQICAVVDPSSGTAVSVGGYLGQLRESLKAGL